MLSIILKFLQKNICLPLYLLKIGTDIGFPGLKMVEFLFRFESVDISSVARR